MKMKMKMKMEMEMETEMEMKMEMRTLVSHAPGRATEDTTLADTMEEDMEEAAATRADTADDIRIPMTILVKNNLDYHLLNTEKLYSMRCHFARDIMRPNEFGWDIICIFQ